MKSSSSICSTSYRKTTGTNLLELKKSSRTSKGSSKMISGPRFVIKQGPVRSSSI